MRVAIWSTEAVCWRSVSSGL